MNAVQILDWARAAGAELSVVGDRLKVNASAGAVTAEMRARIAEHKQELMALLQERERLAALDRPILAPVARDGRLPLSLFQQRLWILGQLHGALDSQFNMVTVWAMPGKDVELLRRSIVDVVRRHEILRSKIPHDEMTPYVQPLPPEAVRIEISDLRALAPADQLRTLDEDVTAAVRERFDLATEPPVRWRIFVGEGGQLVTRVCADHIAADEWSFVLLRRELHASLAACAAGVVLPAPALQYADYAAWERRRLATSTVAAQLAWWQKRLADLPPFCAWPPDLHGRSVSSGTVTFTWDEPFTTRLRELARAHRATLFMVLLSGLAALLRASTGRNDIVMGTSVDVRERTELESMIGGIVNIVVLRLDLEDDPSFAHLLARARDTLIDAHDHREVPFEMLVERLNPHRSLDFMPFFQVSLVMHNASADQPSKIHSGGAAQHLTWFSRETESGLTMSLEYRSDHYLASTIERIARQLETLLRAALERPTVPVSTLPLTTPVERAEVVAGFNATLVTLDRAPLGVQVERQAAATPESIAVRCRGEAVSYDALNRRANRIARHLRGRGAGPGVRIGICMGRSPDLLAALLAVAKSGAAYVPLDPAFPAARLNLMIEHSELSLLLVDAGAPPSTLNAAERVDLEADASIIANHDDANLGIATDPDDPAYIIYTSGSTGRPNGVVVSHASLANFLGAMQREPGMSHRDTVAAVTTISFDIAALELFLPLLVGACIVMVPRAVATDGAALAALLAEERVTFMQATPGTWRILLEAGWRGTSTFVACCGGDALPAELARLLGGCVGVLWNLYGPTETTVWSALGKVEPDHDVMTIGRPIANTQVYVLDAAGQPTPVGVAGEIWIGGAGVATGYWRNPELTRQKFHPDSLAGMPGHRVYRTGDMGRWLPDGRLVHMGRLDQQVKLRGFRIEPGEIEAALETHAAVREAVVVMRGDTPERERLVAYIVYRPGLDLTTSEARQHLRAVLPDYMLPAAFVAIDGIPHTPNGKVERRALPDPFRSAGAASTEYVAPAAGAEEMIARIWADALAVARVGATDNFFDLGGHSLIGLRVAATIRARTGWRMPPYILFQQTLRQIAASLEAHRNGPGAVE